MQKMWLTSEMFEHNKAAYRAFVSRDKTWVSNAHWAIHRNLLIHPNIQLSSYYLDQELNQHTKTKELEDFTKHFCDNVHKLYPTNLFTKVSDRTLRLLTFGFKATNTSELLSMITTVAIDEFYYDVLKLEEHELWSRDKREPIFNTERTLLIMPHESDSFLELIQNDKSETSS